MKLLKITAFFLTITLLSNCAFLPPMIMKTKRSFDKLKGDLGEMQIPPSDDEYYEADDSTYMNEAPAEEDFDFEVVECIEASLFLDKMNVVYVGVDNPCRIFVTNIPSQHVEVSSDNEALKIIEQEGGFYNFIASKPGQAKITVSAGYYEESYEVRMKRIPDPVAKLGIENSGKASVGGFKAQGGIGAWLENFDFDTRCAIESYSMTRIAADGTQEIVENLGSKFNKSAIELQQKAQLGDIYLFENMRLRCSGDNASRSINSLIFRIN
jgi:hypothetical protein